MQLSGQKAVQRFSQSVYLYLKGRPAQLCPPACSDIINAAKIQETGLKLLNEPQCTFRFPYSIPYAGHAANCRLITELCNGDAISFVKQAMIDVLTHGSLCHRKGTLTAECYTLEGPQLQAGLAGLAAETRNEWLLYQALRVRRHTASSPM